ncbi:MAG TPA: MaoC family dehydratase [Gaiellales bacterium]|nr:MaoC family dehydratase [Gaiellales bacterium]
MSVRVGDRAERTVLVDAAAIAAFADVSGDRNPVHLDERYAASTRFGGTVAHGMLTAALVSALLGTELPGPGTVYLGQELRFRAPVRPGERLRCEVEVTDVDARRATIATRAWVGETLVLDGQARVLLP